MLKWELYITLLWNSQISGTYWKLEWSGSIFWIWVVEGSDLLLEGAWPGWCLGCSLGSGCLRASFSVSSSLSWGATNLSQGRNYILFILCPEDLELCLARNKKMDLYPLEPCHLWYTSGSVSEILVAPKHQLYSWAPKVLVHFNLDIELQWIYEIFYVNTSFMNLNNWIKKVS